MARINTQEERIKIVSVNYVSCDICGAKTECTSATMHGGVAIPKGSLLSLPDGYAVVEVVLRSPSRCRKSKTTKYDVCGDCLKSLGLPKDEISDDHRHT